MPIVVRTPATSANLGAGFDVLGLAVGLYADLGVGDPPEGARPVGADHPARVPFERIGGHGPIWIRTSIPMGRGLGFSGAVRVGAAALAACVADGGGGHTNAIRADAERILAVAAEYEGHGDNAAASLHGGVVAYVEGAAVPITVGPQLAAGVVVTWIPESKTSTDRSRRRLSDSVPRRAAVHNIGRAIQFVLAFEHDDPELLAGATDDELHQADRLALVPGARDALDAGVAAGAWCGWLSGSGPTVAFLCSAELADGVVASLPTAAQTKRLVVDTTGARVLPSAG